MEIDKIIIRVLHARITSKQFSSDLDEDTADMVIGSFKNLYKDVSGLKNININFLHKDSKQIDELLKDIKNTKLYLKNIQQQKWITLIMVSLLIQMNSNPCQE